MPRSRPGTRPCTNCGLTMTIRADQICQRCAREANVESRKERPCGVCAKSTTSKLGTHPKCRSVDEPDDIAEAEAALPVGAWRFDPFRRIQVWVPAEPAELPPPDLRECAFDGCEGWFASDNPKQRYCDRRCQNAADRQRRKAREQDQDQQVAA